MGLHTRLLNLSPIIFPNLRTYVQQITGKEETVEARKNASPIIELKLTESRFEQKPKYPSNS